MANRSFPSRLIRVVVADEHPRVRNGLDELLSTYRDIQVVARSASCAEAVDHVRELDPDVVVLGCTASCAGCFLDMREIRRHAPRVRIVVLTLDASLESAARASGADAVVVKGGPSERLIEEIRARGTATRR